MTGSFYRYRKCPILSAMLYLYERHIRSNMVSCLPIWARTAQVLLKTLKKEFNNCLHGIVVCG